MAKHTHVTRKNGNVGKNGITQPKVPSANVTQPMTIYIFFIALTPKRAYAQKQFVLTNIT